jgi:hypothetical protein
MQCCYTGKQMCIFTVCCIDAFKHYLYAPLFGDTILSPTITTVVTLTPTANLSQMF